MRLLAPARLLFIGAIAATLAGCATTQGASGDPKDPWEGLNRKTYAFNDALDRAILKPVAQGYERVVPDFAREGVNNFFDNLDDIATSLNNLLQGKAKEGFSDAGRFAVNSVFGVFGLWDIATPLGLEKHNEDFGQTLGWWGVQPGPYLVLPLLGPSTVRDAPSKAADPSWYYNTYLNSNLTYWGLWGFEKVRSRANLFKAEGVLEEAALDKYSFIRDAWWQRRRNMVYDGNPPREKDEE
ncbi:MAG: MlaA family lipoprotein [Usitatibacter sp.]